MTRASVYIDVHDSGSVSGREPDARPHNVELEFFDSAGNSLAHARSVEPQGYYVVIHPDPKTADCRQLEGYERRREYAECFKRQSYWISTWVESVATARFSSDGCAIASVPVKVTTHMSDWWLWWVPLPHVGSSPYRYATLDLDVTSLGGCER